MGVYIAHLHEEYVLHEIVEGHVPVSLGARVGESLAVGFVPCLVVRPLCEVGRTVGVAQVAVLGVGHEPLAVVGEELLEAHSGERGLALLGKQFAQEAQLALVHALIVYLGQGVELLAQLLIVALPVLIVQGGQLPQVGILRMQGEDADTAIGI